MVYGWGPLEHEGAYWMLDAGYWILVAVSEEREIGYWILGDECN
jgi:hypothetical protein